VSKRLKVLLLLGAFLSLGWFWPDRNFRVVFCDVGQGDAILFSRLNYQILVDGGPSDHVLECLSNNLPFWDRTLEMVILTHPDKDHYQGLLAVAERYRLLYFVWGGLEREDPKFQKLLASISGQGSELIRVEQDDEIVVEEVKINFYWPNYGWLVKQLSDSGIKMTNSNLSKGNKVYKKDSTLAIVGESKGLSLNDSSLVFKISFADFDVLMTGDADSRVQPEILATASLPDVEILKVAHHGSKYAFTDEFLASFNSALAVISVGSNPWGHPTQELLDQLSRFGLEVLRTDRDGEIKLASDGRVWWREE
jgi:competence protein ComEC